MIPAIISFCNIYMIPIDYANIRVGRVFQIAMVIEGVLFLFFMLFQSLLYIIAVTTSRKIEADSTRTAPCGSRSVIRMIFWMRHAVSGMISSIRLQY